MSLNDAMLVAAGAAAVLTGSRFALFTCMVFAAHWVADPHLSDFGYYGGAVLADVLVVYAARVSSPVPRRVKLVQLVSLAFIPVQIVGLIMYSQYLSPAVYNWACTGLYAALLISIMTRDPERERDRMDTAGHIYFCVDSYRATRRLLGFGNEGTRP
jgi:hypothetical protein